MSHQRDCDLISNKPPCKDDNARFTMVLLKALSDKAELDIMFIFLKTNNFQLWMFTKATCAFLVSTAV